MLLLYVPGKSGRYNEPINGRTRFQKMIFLFEKEIWKKFKFDKIIPQNTLPEFTAYNYGPFAKEIYDDLNFLITYGLVEAKQIGGGDFDSDEYRYYTSDIPNRDHDDDNTYHHSYYLTEAGEKFVDRGEAGELTPNQTDVLSEFKKKVNSIPLDALVEYVYTKYPETTTNSRIREKVLSKAKTKANH